MIDTAPTEFVYCPRCASPLETRLTFDKQRRVCPACGYIHFTDPKVGVGIVALRDGRILLVRRRMNPERGKWSIPAGFVDRGEDPRETAVREALEETNLHVAITGLIDVYFNPPKDGFSSSIFIMFRAEILGGEIQAGDDADAVDFFNLDDLPELAFASTLDAVARLKAKG
ncbi:MAG: NUDIX hydrolase [Ardenticatenaceae bacterium]|nr:NUDIX hydrolase [Anaerolineales bacterium]MCB8920605.1 NUDIX hydrolase [Ardenticatenaceae bacterium]MCB8990229.1 NUDIX hydrolase [Ardenticatenaceae bacterium]MCB9002979.1 NUDIX hydrolase [Ardenticatenaceae bacterium]